MMWAKTTKKHRGDSVKLSLFDHLSCKSQQRQLENSVPRELLKARRRGQPPFDTRKVSGILAAVLERLNLRVLHLRTSVFTPADYRIAMPILERVNIELVHGPSCRAWAQFRHAEGNES
jgi:hypothetical protein